jgi:hypothetical protein
MTKRAMTCFVEAPVVQKAERIVTAQHLTLLRLNLNNGHPMLNDAKVAALSAHLSGMSSAVSTCCGFVCVT